MARAANDVSSLRVLVKRVCPTRDAGALTKNLRHCKSWFANREQSVSRVGPADESHRMFSDVVDDWRTRANGVTGLLG